MTDLILASGSAIRRQILSEAGVVFQIDRPQVDEAALKEAKPDLGATELALMLAEEKALEVSRRRPDALVLGGDQVLGLDGRKLDKSPDRDAARARLIELRGRAHALHAGLAAARQGEIVWRHKAISTLYVRDFSDEFLDHYMNQAGDELTASVGAYAYEGLGAQLFEAVDGDFYSVLGLPLLPVLDLLRREGVIPA